MANRAQENLSRPSRIAQMEIRRDTGQPYKQILSAGVLALRELSVDERNRLFARANDKDYEPTIDDVIRLFALLPMEERSRALDTMAGMVVVDAAGQTEERHGRTRVRHSSAKGA